MEERTEGFAELAGLVADYTPSEVERITGVPAADVERAVQAVHERFKLHEPAVVAGDG